MTNIAIAGVYPVDVQSMNVDLLAFTGHKGLLGSQGTGGLYIREGFYPRPLKEGGTGGHSILERMPDDLPDRYEPGTLNAAGLAGLGEAVKFILDEGIERIRRHEMDLTGYAMKKLEGITGITMYGPQNQELTVGVVSFNLIFTGKNISLAIALAAQFSHHLRWLCWPSTR